MNDTKISIRLDPQTERWLRDEASASGKQEGEFVRELLISHFSSHSRYASALEVAYLNEIIGCPNDLPVDSSADEDRFEAFSR